MRVLAITVFPVASEAAILPMASIRGKFQGQMAPTTPIGIWRVVKRRISSSWTTSSSGSLHLAYGFSI